MACKLGRELQGRAWVISAALEPPILLKVTPVDSSVHYTRLALFGGWGAGTVICVLSGVCVHVSPGRRTTWGMGHGRTTGPLSIFPSDALGAPCTQLMQCMMGAVWIQPCGFFSVPKCQLRQPELFSFFDFLWESF